MKDANDKLTSLLKEGEGFTYQSFSRIGEYGYPNAYAAEWLVWTSQVKVLLHRLFGSGGPTGEMIKAAEEIQLLGNNKDEFERVRAYYIGALESGCRLIDDSILESSAPVTYSTRVFVAHGHDDKAKAELEVLLSEIGLEPVVLHRQPDGGRTVIEKFEQYSDVGYAFILLTPDEVAYLSTEEGTSDELRTKERRARPNVIFEFGYFVGKLGRSRVCCLYTGNVSIPSDVHGILYKRYETKVEEVGYSLIRELRAAGYKISLDRGSLE